MRRLRTRAAAVIALAAAVAAGAPSTGTAHARTHAFWTVRQAKAIPTVRSLPVNVVECRGLGRTVTRHGARRYARFRCTAGTRAPWERYDTITVQYVLHPLARYRAERPRYAVTQVRFIGGPGIP